MGTKEQSWETLDSGKKENKEEKISRWEAYGRTWAAGVRWRGWPPIGYLTGPSNSTCAKQKHLVPKSYLLFSRSVDGVTICPHLQVSSQTVHSLFIPVFLISFSLVPSKYFSNPLTFLHHLCYQSCLQHHYVMLGHAINPRLTSPMHSPPWPVSSGPQIWTFHPPASALWKASICLRMKLKIPIMAHMTPLYLVSANQQRFISIFSSSSPHTSHKGTLAFVTACSFHFP